MTVDEVPAPSPRPGHVVVRNHCSLVSAGTERAMVEFARQSLVGKARGRPDLVREVVDKARREGILSTLQAVNSRLDQRTALGYSCAGTVIAVGDGVTDIRVGDGVACGGASYAVHAESVSVPKNLVVKMPDGLDFESAAFTTLGAIALHGLHLAGPRVGETVAVIGLGLVGLITVQLARATGCRVVGMDPDSDRCRLAEQLGCSAATTDAERFATEISQVTSDMGTDGVIVCAATSGSEPVELAGRVARERSTVVVVGDVNIDVPRRLYYEKELTLRVSRSYGPGRYDPEYEEKGHDYPAGYVRWTENRNMQAFVQLLADGSVTTGPLVTHRFRIEEGTKAYDLIADKSGKPFMGVLITYPETTVLSRRVELRPDSQSSVVSKSPNVNIGLLGAGSFATSTLLPAIKKVSGVELIGVCASTGASARRAGDKFGFAYCTTEEDEIVNDASVNTVVVATRHHLHSRQVVAALEAGRNVFCEKPLALNDEELGSIVETFGADRANALMVGYNRRFAPMADRLKAFLAEIGEPPILHYRVNAGEVALDHWVQDPEQGGGRIVGEVCHFVDFLTFLTGSLPVRVYARSLANGGRYRDDNVAVTLDFANGSVGVITYVANGDKSFPKERLEAFGGGAVAVLDDFRRLELVRNGVKKAHSARGRADKGHRGEWEAFVTAMRDGAPPSIPFDEIVSTSLTTFRIMDSLRSGASVEVDVRGFLASPVAEKASSSTKSDTDNAGPSGP